METATLKWEYDPEHFLKNKNFEHFTPTFHDNEKEIAMKRAIPPRHPRMESEGDMIIKFNYREINTGYGGYIKIYMHYIKDGMIVHIQPLISMLYINSDKDMEFLFERLAFLNWG